MFFIPYNEEESISGPIGELISIIAARCNVKESTGYFLSKKKIAFFSHCFNCWKNSFW